MPSDMSAALPINDACKGKITFGAIAFLGWTITSFLCHQFARLFLKTSNTVLDCGILWAIIITLCQVTMCCLLTELYLCGSHSSKAQKTLWVKVICHGLATLATNYSMTLVHASSTFAIKLLEPVTSAIIQCLVLGKTLPASSYFSLPVIISGAVGFCGTSLNTTMSFAGIAMALLSNLILGFRNVAIKLEQGDPSSKTVQLRRKGVVLIITGVCLFLAVVFELISSRNLVSTSISFLVRTALLSSFLHVVYSYISTNVVLLYMSVVSHSVANIFKRVLVVLLLYSVGKREAMGTNFFWLAICTFGLIMYVVSKKAGHGSVFIMSSSVSAGFRFLGICLLGICFVGVSHNYVRINHNVADEYGHVTRSVLRDDTREFYGKSFKGISFSSYIRDFSLDFAVPNDKANVDKFLNTKLIKTPTETDILSPKLTTSIDIIKEAQRIQFNLFSDILSPYKYAILLDIAAFENKGDPAITTGEVYLLRRLGIKIVYYCSTYRCTNKTLDRIQTLATNYSHKDLIVLLHGGGNLVGYPTHDILRDDFFKRFSNFQMMLFPQSVFLKKDLKKHFLFCQELYQKKDNFTMILRDRQSLAYAERYFKGKPNLMMAPDMAFQIGAVPRFISPSFDILWLKREDVESPRYTLPLIPPDITVLCSDWIKWYTPKGKKTMETAVLMANNGLIFLQRGRVVITDRLHGHILSTLLDIPHVLIDNEYAKLSAYHNTWTRSLANTVVAENATHALELAVQLLHKHNDVLPPIAPYMNVPGE
ncbi:uncharacterized protein LOC124275602 isoform X2 [Haliotis rubra]|uniref:uncharacterized protein LOC124275602 isoform X2 n=1 Tax=Haliotis rubra TaxID=36100 RepID=UPI001EE4EEF2|nr:uncharacterized protein LOC124275602 isoform X2 [Haliotis rubra]